MAGACVAVGTPGVVGVIVAVGFGFGVTGVGAVISVAGLATGFSGSGCISMGTAVEATSFLSSPDVFSRELGSCIIVVGFGFKSRTSLSAWTGSNSSSKA